MPETWPTSLPPPSSEYSMALSTPLLRGRQGGLTASRSTGQRMVAKIAANWLLTPSEVVTFRAFGETLGQWGDAFYCPLYFGDGLHTVLCRFDGPPQETSAHAGFVQFSGSLLVNTVPVMPAEWLDSFLSLLSGGLSDTTALDEVLTLSGELAGITFPSFDPDTLEDVFNG